MEVASKRERDDTIAHRQISTAGLFLVDAGGRRSEDNELFMDGIM